MPISNAEREYIIDGVDDDLRNDGRGRLDYRHVTIDLGVVPQSSGSARVRLGIIPSETTDVIVAVKADIGTPGKENPHHGRIQCAVELAATADVDYMGRGGETQGLELAKALERSLTGQTTGGMGSLTNVVAGERNTDARVSKHGPGAALDMSALGITKGKTCWILQCDGVVLTRDGSVLDALSIAVKCALADAKIPKGDRRRRAGRGRSRRARARRRSRDVSRLDVSGVPLIVTCVGVGPGRHVVDATDDEEDAGRDCPALSCAVDRKGSVRSVTSGGGGGLDLGVMRAMHKTAREKGVELNEAVDTYLLTAKSGSDGAQGADGDDVMDEQS
jgi:exosome complex component RRP42